MKIDSLRVRNFRTIGSTEQTLIIGSKGTTIVGPNNTGKSNLLHAVELFFTGAENLFGYMRERDLTFGAGSAKTSLVATFSGDPEGADKEIFESYDRLTQFVDVRTRTHPDFTLSLQMSPSNQPVYQFFPNARKTGNGAEKTQFSRTQSRLVNDLLGSFSCNYVPASKTMSTFHEQMVLPRLSRTVALSMAGHENTIAAALREVSLEINSSLDSAGLGNLKTSFSIPENRLESLFRNFEYELSDPNRTSIHHKGQGVQSAALLATLNWISKTLIADGVTPIWLLEEPESYLHPELSRAALRLVGQLQSSAPVLVTTHDLSFVPQNVQQVQGTHLEEGRTTLTKFANYREATASLADSLGVSFSDYFNLADLNVLVEGPSDRELISWALAKFLEKDPTLYPHLQGAALLDFGGVKHLSGFLRANYRFIRNERATVTLFDGDEAGRREWRDLQSHLGRNSSSFQSNLDFVTVRTNYSIEGLFPDEWMIEINNEYPDWFSSFAIDSQGSLEPYAINDDKKNQVQKTLIRKAEESSHEKWGTRWKNLFEALESALISQVKRIERHTDSTRAHPLKPIATSTEGR